jgi:hypothetical protein
MFSKILIKLIDQAILPALVIFASRILSLFLFAGLFDITLTVDRSGIVFQSPRDYVLINSYSIMFMSAVLCIAILHNLIKAYYFHDTHITPKLTARLFSMKLSSFIQSSMQLYSEGVIWLSYSFLLTLVAGLMAFFGLCFYWVFFASLLLTVVSTVLFLLDIEKELVVEKKLKTSSDVTLNLKSRVS